MLLTLTLPTYTLPLCCFPCAISPQLSSLPQLCPFLMTSLGPVLCFRDAQTRQPRPHLRDAQMRLVLDEPAGGIQLHTYQLLRCQGT